MYGNADRSGLIRNSACDGLANPPGRICAELEALRIIEFIDGLNKSQITFLDQIEKLHAASEVTLGNGNNETKVRLDQHILGVLISDKHALCKILLLVRGQKRYFSDLLQVHTNRIVKTDSLAETGVQINII